jgi:hypothetical protein
VTQGRGPWIESQAAPQLNQVVTNSPICSLDAWLTLSQRQTHEIHNLVTPR